jgi:pilus assembly protein CpaC
MPGSRRKTLRSQFFGWLTAIVFVMGLCAPALLAQGSSAAEPVVLVVGRSTVIQAPWPTVRVAVTDPKVADVQVLTPQQVLVQAFKVGTTDLILWSEGEKETLQRQVIVKLDIESIQKTLDQLFPNAELQATESGEVLVVKGLLRSADEVTQLRDYLQKTKIPYVDMTGLSGVQQVQLQVRVAEVSRAAIRQLGINAIKTGQDFFFGQRVGNVAPAIGIEAQSFLAPADFDNLFFSTPGGGTGSSVTFFAGFPKQNFELFLEALAENQYVRLLATPTLVAQSGEEASFLAGGEFPIPVPQGGGAGVGGQATITIEYKEFGVRLVFRPMVLGENRIRLSSAQEVSELTTVGAIRLGDFVVPALTTRRAEATIELKSGQSFALAGLLRNTDTATTSRIPGLGDLPVLGPLFRSVEYRNEETELVIFVTASLVEPMSVAKAPPLPGALHVRPDDWELYLEGRLEGQGPALLDPSSAEWLKQMGLDQLAGPGAWDSYEEQDFNATMRVAEAAEKTSAGAEKTVESK